jgi:hypothetical protein
MGPSIDPTALFCQLDDFVAASKNQPLLANPERQRNRPCGLCVSEVMTILALFHFSHFRTFKPFRLFCLKPYYRVDFPGLPFYTRFVEGIGSGLTALCALLLSHMGEATGAAFMPGRPEEFHHQPPTESCINLSIYTARPSHSLATSQ